MRDPLLPPGLRPAAQMALCLVAVVLVACSSRSPNPGAEGGGDASCAFVATFRGQDYEGFRAMVLPVPGKVLGEAVVPPCEDGSGGDDHPSRMEVARLPGIDPGDALVQSDDPSQILVRAGLRPIPPEILRFLEPLPCDAADPPGDLRGPWLGILGADGRTELDMVPPYDLMMLVEEASAVRYQRANLTIRVPASLGQPLTREDVRSSLWEGGDIRVTAACDGDRFVARQVEAFPG